jgi:phage-related protein
MGIIGPDSAALKPLVWIGSSKKDLIALPRNVAREFGYGLYLAQVGRRHESSRVLRGLGDAGVIELIESRVGSTYRAVYTVRFSVAVFVLHVFQKKSKHGIATPKRELDLIAARLRRAAELAKEMK